MYEIVIALINRNLITISARFSKISDKFINLKIIYEEPSPRETEFIKKVEIPLFPTRRCTFKPIDSPACMYNDVLFSRIWY